MTPGGASVPGKVGDVASKCCPGACHGGHARKEEVGFGAAVDSRLQSEDVARAAGLVYTPAHGCEGCDRRRDELCNEKVAKFGGRDQQ